MSLTIWSAMSNRSNRGASLSNFGPKASTVFLVLIFTLSICNMSFSMKLENRGSTYKASPCPAPKENASTQEVINVLKCEIDKMTDHVGNLKLPQSAAEYKSLALSGIHSEEAQNAYRLRLATIGGTEARNLNTQTIVPVIGNIITLLGDFMKSNFASNAKTNAMNVANKVTHQRAKVKEANAKLMSMALNTHK